MECKKVLFDFHCKNGIVCIVVLGLLFHAISPNQVKKYGLHIACRPKPCTNGVF